MTVSCNKHKDLRPEETVKRIRELLASAEIPVEICLTGEEYEAYSNRISIPGTHIGANGKGTTREYALASGYAEFMERLQNYSLNVPGRIAYASWKEAGFYMQPDEVLTPAKDIVRRRGPGMEALFGNTDLRDDAARRDMLEKLSLLMFGRGDGLIPEVPFVDVFRGEILYLPLAWFRMSFGTNGMAAGNSMAECLVQGLSEIFERYVNIRVLNGRTALPPIPREFLSSREAGEIISRIEESGRYRVQVFDGSLNKGYPVVMTMITDQEDGSFGIKFGAHPSLAIAVERTLTEAFQGRTLENLTHMNSFLPRREKEGLNKENLRQVIRDGSGLYPPSLLLKKPEWDFVPWGVSEEASNEEMLRDLLSLLRREGRTVLVRDVSHLGFPACMIVVPGLSDLSGDTVSRINRGLEREEKLQSLSRFPLLSDDAKRFLLESDPLSTGVAADMTSFDRPFAYSPPAVTKLFGSLHLSLGNFREASLHFRKLSEDLGGLSSLYWKIMADYAACRGEGIAREDALRILRSLYYPALVERVERNTVEDDTLLTRGFPSMNCDDCGHCEAGEKGMCLGVREKEMVRRIRRALAASQVRQEPLKDYLSSLIRSKKMVRTIIRR